MRTKKVKKLSLSEIKEAVETTNKWLKIIKRPIITYSINEDKKQVILDWGFYKDVEAVANSKDNIVSKEDARKYKAAIRAAVKLYRAAEYMHEYRYGPNFWDATYWVYVIDYK